MILKVRRLNVIMGDSIVVCLRNETNRSRRPSASAFGSCAPKKGYRRKASPWPVISTALTSAVSNGARGEHGWSDFVLDRISII